MKPNTGNIQHKSHLERAYHTYLDHGWQVIKTRLDRTFQGQCLLVGAGQGPHPVDFDAVALKCDRTLFSIEVTATTASKLISLTRGTKAAGPVIYSPSDTYHFLVAGHIPEGKTTDDTWLHDLTCAILLPPTIVDCGNFGWKVHPCKSKWTVPRAVLLHYALIELG